MPVAMELSRIIISEINEQQVIYLKEINGSRTFPILIGIFEATTNHAYKQMLARIAASNEAIASGAPGEFGRIIRVREIKSEVSLHYLFNFNQRRFREEVEHGVASAPNRAPLHRGAHQRDRRQVPGQQQTDAA